MTVGSPAFDGLSGAGTGAGDADRPPGVAAAADRPPAGIATLAGDGGEATTRLVLVRHGEAHCNVSGVCGGPVGCRGLTDRGRAQVEALRDRLAATAELEGCGALYASVLPRARETAAVLAPVLLGRGGSVRARCDLCELHPGEADGMAWPEFTERFGAPDWDVDPDHPIAPGGESWTGFVRRVGAALDELAAAHPGELVVVACHAGVVEASLLTKLPVAGGTDGARLQLRTRHASMTTWEVEPDADGGRWRLSSYNDVAEPPPRTERAAQQA